MFKGLTSHKRHYAIPCGLMTIRLETYVTLGGGLEEGGFMVRPGGGKEEEGIMMRLGGG